MHMTLKNWTARRSGAAITVVGHNAGSGERIKLSDVADITPAPGGRIIATTRGGSTHTLLTA